MDIHELNSIYLEENLAEEFAFLAKESDVPVLECWDESYCDECVDEDIDDTFLEEYDVKRRPLLPGQIVMVERSRSSERTIPKPHKMLIVSSEPLKFGVVKYTGYLLSSKMYKANIEGKYPNNIYIEDLISACSEVSSGMKHESSILKVDELHEFTNKDMAKSGVWKGTAKPEFISFIYDCRRNFTSGNEKLNFDMTWE